MVLRLIRWSVGARPKRRRLVHAVRDHAFLPDHRAFEMVSGSFLLLHLTLLVMLRIGHTRSGSWLSGLLS